MVYEIILDYDARSKKHQNKDKVDIKMSQIVRRISFKELMGSAKDIDVCTNGYQQKQNERTERFCK